MHRKGNAKKVIMIILSRCDVFYFEVAVGGGVEYWMVELYYKEVKYNYGIFKLLGEASGYGLRQRGITKGSFGLFCAKMLLQRYLNEQENKSNKSDRADSGMDQV
jgi:hypothetical protein